MSDFLSNKKMIDDAMDSITSVTLKYYENKAITSINVPKQIYIKKIVDNTFAILNTFKELDYVASVILDFSLNLTEKNNTEEIIYHLKNHFIRISSLQDLAKNLICNVYRLGISEKKCSIDLLLDNEFTKGSEALSNLIKLKNCINESRIKRNRIIHHGEFEDKQIEPVIILNFQKFNITNSSYDNSKIDPLIKNNLEKIYFSINEESTTLKTCFESLYDSLQIIYDSKINDFDTKQKMHQ